MSLSCSATTPTSRILHPEADHPFVRKMEPESIRHHHDMFHQKIHLKQKCFIHTHVVLFCSDKKMLTYPTNNVETEMPLNLAAKVQRQSTQNGFFVYSSGGQPFILNKPSNTLLQFWWKLPVIHPLFCIFLSKSPLFNSCSCRLQIILFFSKR